jgi:hypothetical protein
MIRSHILYPIWLLDLLEEVEIHVIEMLYPDSDEEKSEKSEQGLAAC